VARHYLKRAAVQAGPRNAEVEATVRRMIADIAEHRDEAVRKYARDLDKWTGEFRVPQSRIDEVSRTLPTTFKEDVAYCHKQVTEFAKRQKDSLQAFEVELQPGVMLGQKLIPISTAGCYIPGG
jgi:sulfopropanediol 3-dehydrogenase